MWDDGVLVFERVLGGLESFWVWFGWITLIMADFFLTVFSFRFSS